MTIEELLKKNREIRGLQSNDETIDTTTSIETPTTDTVLSDIEKSVMQSRATRESFQNSNYASALTKAQQEGEWISHEFNRDKLSDWAQHYYDEMNKSEANTEDYIKNQILYSKVADQMKLLGAPEVDFGKEISVGVRNSIANSLLTAQKVSEELPLRTDTNMEEYYLKNIYYNNGKARATRNSFTEESVVNNLKDLKEAYKDDELIQKLYDTVIDRKYNVASDDYFNAMSRYATEKLKELRYKESLIYERTRDEKEELERLKRTEALSGYGKLTQGVLDATGVVSNMAPSIAMGYVAGGLGQLAGASSGTVGALNQIGSLGTMGTSAYGDAFDQSIKEGYGWGKSDAYADVVFATEVLSEVVGGETVMSALGGAGSKTLTSGIAQKLISKGKNPLAKWMIGMAWDVGAEAIEEMIAEAIEPLAGKAILGKDITPEEYWKGILESAGGSVLPTLILGGFGKARIVNHVTAIDRSLRVQLADLRAKGAITQQEYDTMRNDLSSWTNNAIAGVTERYEEIKNETTGELEKKGIDYNDAMKQINDRLSKREQGTTEILNLASKLSKIETLTNEEKQSQIEEVAKKYNISNEKLVELYNEFPNVMKDVLPSTYEQARNTEYVTALGRNMIENIKSITNSKIEGTNKKMVTIDRLGKEMGNRPLKDYSKKFLKLAKTFTPRKRDSGVYRLEIDDGRSIASFKLGSFDENKKPTTEEINSSPILIESLVKDDASAENGEPTRKLYVYDNFDDFEKDIVASFGSIEDFLDGRSDTVNTVITMSGKGGYEMAIKDGKAVWNDKSGETKISDSERKIEPSKKKKRKPRTTSEDTREMLEDSKDTNYEKKDGFYSQVEKVIATKMPNRANGETIMNLLAKNGAKQDELNWLDMDTFLNSKAFFTKQEVLDYIRANQLELKEIRNEVKHNEEKEVMSQQRLEELTHKQVELEDKLEELEDKAVRTFRRNDINEFEMRDVRRLFNHIRDGETTLEEEFDVDALVENLYAYGFGDMSEEEIDDYIASEVQNYEDVIKAIQPIYDEWFETKEALFSVEAELDELDEEDYVEDTTRFRHFATSFKGGSNYREVLFTLPDFEGKPFYVRQHWADTKNVVAHTRLQDYKDDSGNDVLFIEEVQSDMHQQGREKGYSNSKKVKELNNELKKKQQEADELYEKIEQTDEYKKYKEVLAKHAEAQNKFNDNYQIDSYNRKLIDMLMSMADVRDIENDAEYKERLIADLARAYIDNKRITSAKAEQMARDAIDEYVKLVSEKSPFNQDFHEAEHIFFNSPLRKQLDVLNDEIKELKGKVQDADVGISDAFPLKKTWHEFVLRKIINEAVDKGYDKVAWASGEQNNERYDLTKYVKQIDYDQNSDGTYNAHTFNEDGGRQLSFYNKSEKELEDIFGKEMTRKIISGEYDVKANYNYGDAKSRIGRIEGVDLKMGGEGNRAFYDKIIPEYLNKYLKKWNSKVEDVVIDGHHQMGFTITPEMKEAIENEGQVLFDTKESTPSTSEASTTKETTNKKEPSTNRVAPESNMFMDMLTDIEAMYKMSDMEKKGSPVLETTDMINKGELPRQEGRNETSRVEITNMIKNFLKGKFGKLRGMKRKSAYGTHNRQSGWVRLGEITNIDTAFHELGHYINTTALKDKVDFDRSIKDELIKLCEARWSGRYKGETRLREGFAEAIRNWVEDREVFAINNPELVKFFEEQRTKSKELEEAFGFLEQLHEKVIDYENMTELQKARALRRNDIKEVNVDSMLRRMGTRIIFNTFNDAVYSNKFDRFRAKVFGKKYADMLSQDKLEDTIKLAGNRDQTLTQLREGLINWNTGKKITHGLRAITEVVMPTKQQAKELGMKYDNLYAQNLDDAGLYAQLKRMEYLYESERDIENLGLRKQEVEKAIEQLMDETTLSKKQLDEFTKMVNEDSEALINYAYEQRKISAEERDSLLNDNQFYAPLNRITESEALGKNERRRSTKRAFYRLEGSDLQLENPFVALASNWGSIIRAVDENNVYIRFAEMLKEVGEAGGDYGLWAETNVTPKMKFKGNIDLGAFEDTLRAQFKKIQEEYKIDTRNGDIVKLMNLEATASLFGLADIDADERIVSYTDNGVRKYIQFADNDWGRGMFDLLTGVNNVSGDFYTSLAQELNAGLKMGATAMNMEFALGNMQSDAMMRYITSDTDFIHRVYFPVITNVVNAINYMKHRGEWLPNWHPVVESEMYKKFEQSGVAQSGKFQSNLENLKKDRAKAFGDASDAIFKNVRKTKKLRKPSEVLTESKLGEFLSWIPEISEQATRFAEFSGVYNKMIKDGKSEAVAIREATIKARQVTQDFTVQGKIMRDINKVIPFASATVGGLYRMSQEARNNPERFTIRMSGLALMTLIISSLIKDDDRDWYEEINEQKRFDNFILPNLLNPDDKQHPMIIKKPQGPARGFVNLVQMLYDAGMGYVSNDEGGEVFIRWLTKSLEEVSPVNDYIDLLPGPLIGLVENQVNLDFYYKTPIVPKELQNLDPRNQYDDTTSEFAKHIGKIFNWSPKKIDNAWEQMFAGTGKQFTNLYSDLTRLITGTENPLPAKDQSEYTFGNRVYVNALKNPTSVNKVYERIEELEREKAEGRMTDEQEVEYAKLQEAKSALAQISKQIKANRTDSSKTRKEKKARLDELQILRADTARYYLGKTLLNKDNANNVELISFYPSQDTYTYNKNEVSFADEAIKKEYAEMFKKEYEANLKKLRATAEYKNASATRKAELEKDAKSKARTATTNKMKKTVYQRNK